MVKERIAMEKEILYLEKMKVEFEVSLLPANRLLPGSVIVSGSNEQDFSGGMHPHLKAVSHGFESRSSYKLSSGVSQVW